MVKEEEAIDLLGCGAGMGVVRERTSSTYILNKEVTLKVHATYSTFPKWVTIYFSDLLEFIKIK